MLTNRRSFLKMGAAASCSLVHHSVSLGEDYQARTDAGANGVQFVDVTSEAGIRFDHERAASADKLLVEIMGAGCAWLDYDQDGFLDAFFVNSGRTPLFRPAVVPQPALYRNNGDGTFSDVTHSSGIRVEDGFFCGVAVGDYDNDGYPDIYMTGYERSLLFKNNGDGTFSDVTAHAGVANEGGWAIAAGWFDFDHDGRLDLLVTNYVEYDWLHDPNCGRQVPGLRTYCDPFHFKGQTMRLYHNNGDGTFTDWTKRSGLSGVLGKSLGLVLADLNGDGWDDILIANDGMRTFFFINQKDGTFRDASFESGAGFGQNGETESGMGIDVADVTGDGSMDFYVCHMDAQINRLYENDGSGNFTDITQRSGLGMTNWMNTSFGVRIFDWDNDGNRDLLVVNGSMLDNIALYHPDSSFAESKTLYRNVGEGRFADVTHTQGSSFMIPKVGRGLAVGDYDNDGSMDFLQSNNGQLAQLFQNRRGNNNHWLGVKLIGTRSNRDAVGAAIRIKSGAFTSHDQVKGGMSYGSAQDLRVYFGLGVRTQVDLIEVRWPSGDRESFRDIAVDQILLIEERKGIRSFQFPKLRRIGSRNSGPASRSK